MNERYEVKGSEVQSEEQNEWQEMADEVLKDEKNNLGWLNERVEDALEYREDELESLERDGYNKDSSEVQDVELRIDSLRRQERVLENLHIGEEGVLGALQQEYLARERVLSNMENASDEAREIAYRNFAAVSELLGIMEKR